MKVNAQKQGQPQKQASPNITRSRAEPRAASIWRLQRTIGNQAVQRLFQTNAAPSEVNSESSAPTRARAVSRKPVSTESSSNFQAKLAVNAPGDIYEQDADRVAEQVMRISEAQVQRTCACDLGKCSRCQNERGAHEHIQTKRAQTNVSVQTAAPPIVHEALRSSSQPLDPSTREFMESRFGQDFSHVLVHTDARAAESTRAVNALAYTVGGHVVFGEKQYSPHTTDGRRLLAHELTHVVQQSHPTVNVAVAPSSGQLNVSSTNGIVLSRFPSPVSFGTYEPGLSYMPPVIKEGYDGKAYTAIKNIWGLSSWERRWQIYDAEDKLLYESYYTVPHPTLYIPKDVVAKGKAGGKITPWSVWHEVTKTLVPFGGSNSDNFPYTYMKFYVYETWKDFMADPNAKLSDIKQEAKPGAEPGKPTPLESSIAKGAGSVVDYGSVVAMHEAYLREIYDKSAKGITETAKELVTKGLPQGDAAKWANEARNALKEKIRADGNPILKKVFEARNLKEYSNKLGPSYEKLFQKYAKQGLSPEEINKKIIGGAGKANIKVNRWSGRLKVAGRIMLFIDIALAGVRVYLAPEGEKTKVALEEVARIGGALAMGAVGAEAGAAAGAAVGALFAGIGAAPGAVIGGILGGIGGAIFGGWLAQTAVEKLYEILPPSDCVFEGDFKEEDR